MTSYIIEQGIPLPAGNGRKLLHETEVIASLNPGESVVLPYTRSVHNCVQSVRLGTNRKFVTKKLDADHMRVWRVA